MSDPSTLLLVEDNPGDADLVADLLADAIPPLDVIHVQRIHDALDRLRERPFDAILLDLSLPDATGLNGLRRIRAAAPNIPVVMLTGSADHALGASAVRDGAQDYLVKGEADGEALARAIRYAVERHRSAERDRALAEECARRLAAEEGVRTRDEFLAIVSHELRTPITSLGLQAELLLKMGERSLGDVLVSNAQARFRAIHRQTVRLAHLVRALLDITHITAGRLALHPEPLDLAAVVREAMARWQEDLSRAHCALELRIGESIPGRWDRQRIEQIIDNLVANAMKFGAGKPVEVTLEADGASAHLVVSDHGIGITPEDQRRIFERFERAVPAKHYGGFGLGLWTVRNIVEAHGGEISVSSEPGRGSRFEVTLPRDVAA